MNSLSKKILSDFWFRTGSPISDLVLIDLAMPRGYASFHVLDVWGNRAFLSDEKNKLVLCGMTLE